MFSQSHKIAIYMKINLISKPCWLTERLFCQIPIAITAPILGTPVLWLKPSSQIGMVVIGTNRTIVAKIAKVV